MGEENNKVELNEFMEKSIDAFMEQLPSMFWENEGKYVAFREKEHLEFWDSRTDCYNEACKIWGNVPMLIRQVSRQYQEFGKYGIPVNIF